MMVNLIDETVREGDARGFHPKTPAGRMALVGLVQEIFWIREFSIGWAAISLQDRDILDARRRGEIPFWGVGSSFWGLIAGYGVAVLLERKDLRAPA